MHAVFTYFPCLHMCERMLTAYSIMLLIRICTFIRIFTNKIILERMYLFPVCRVIDLRSKQWAWVHYQKPHLSIGSHALPPRGGCPGPLVQMHSWPCLLRTHSDGNAECIGVAVSGAVVVAVGAPPTQAGTRIGRRPALLPDLH